MRTTIALASLVVSIGGAVASPFGKLENAVRKRQTTGQLAQQIFPEVGKLGVMFGGKSDEIATMLLDPLLGDFAGGALGVASNVINNNAGKVAAPPGAPPKRVVMPTRSKVSGAQTVKIRYGPYKVPSMMMKNVLGEAGSLNNFPDRNIEKPCDGDCTILGMTGNLEYVNGTTANTNTGMWLHHTVLFAQGPGHTDATCENAAFSMPHMIVGGTSRTSERIFSVGNERTQAQPELWGEKNVGYKIAKEDRLSLLVDFMNDNKEEKLVYLTITYDVLPGIQKDYDDLKVIWFDVDPCGNGDFKPPKSTGKWQVDWNWTSTYDAEILGIAGHLHDGGDHITLAVNNEILCDSAATYGGHPEYIQPPMGHQHSNTASEHISKMGFCDQKALKQKELKKGQKWKMTAYYDYDKFKGVKHDDGSPENVMGITLMWVRMKNVKR